MATELSTQQIPPLCALAESSVSELGTGAGSSSASAPLQLRVSSAPAPRQLRSSSAPRELDLKKIEERAESLQLRSSGAFHEKKIAIAAYTWTGFLWLNSGNRTL